MVIIFSVFVSLFSHSSWVLLYLYTAPNGFYFLEEEELGTFWYHMCLTSDLEPALVRTNYNMTILCHRLNMFQKCSPNVLGKIDTLNY